MKLELCCVMVALAAMAVGGLPAHSAESKPDFSVLSKGCGSGNCEIGQTVVIKGQNGTRSSRATRPPIWRTNAGETISCQLGDCSKKNALEASGACRILSEDAARYVIDEFDNKVSSGGVQISPIEDRSKIYWTLVWDIEPSQARR